MNAIKRYTAFFLDIWINFFEVYFVTLNKKFIFGKNMIPPRTLNNKEVIAVANANVFPIIIEAKNTSVNVPKFAPRIKGIAFFKLIKRATAKGTNKPIVMLEEKTIAVNITPII